MKVKINDRFYDFFSNIIIDRVIDSVASTFSLTGLFDPNNKYHIEIFKPLAYNVVKIYDDNSQLLLTGYTVSNRFVSNSSTSLHTITGYSITGILNDVNISYKDYPLEKNNVSLNDIVTQVLKPFNIEFVVYSSKGLIDSQPSRSDIIEDIDRRKSGTMFSSFISVLSDGVMDVIYESTVAEVTETIASYLSKLSSQRNVVMSHNSLGQLVFFKPSKYSKPKYSFNRDSNNVISMSLKVNGQGIHSEITVIRQPSFFKSDLTPTDTVYNKMVKIFKPRVKVLTSGEEVETKNAADNLIASELSNIEIELSLKGSLNVIPGDIVEVQNKQVYLINKTRLMVKKITIKEDSKSYITNLLLVLPESYNGEEPLNIFE